MAGAKDKEKLKAKGREKFASAAPTTEKNI